MNKFDPTSHNITDENKAELKALFPEAFTEQGIDFDRLKTLLGEVVETGPERYSFTWPGKTEAIRAAQASSMGTLVPDKASSVDWDTTENLYLEGDNLEILKLLQKSYTGKVKMIYIDPPYNTGKDFVYPDKYGEGLKTYLEYTGQIDGEGKKLSTNPETDGRYHSKWLNMMYPRLMLARNLLKDDGVIFVSIDDHEGHNLRKIMDEVFGAENFVADIIWNSTKSVTNTALISVAHTHNFVYAKTIEYWTENREEFRLPETGQGFTNPDNDPRGPWKADPFQVGGWRPNQQYEIKNPKTGEVYKPNPESSWKNDYERFQELMADSRIVFGTTGEAGPQRKRFLSEALERGRVSTTLWDDIETTANGTKTVKDLFGGSYFTNPKPISLIKRFAQLSTKKDDIIVDFFAGSGTTAHAVMDMNAEDGGSRHFILSQLQEPTPEDSEARKAGYANIAEIGKERIRRAGEKVRKEHAEKITKRGVPLDTGFKTYRLTPSTFNVWDVKNGDDIQQKLVGATSLIKDNAKEEEVLTELILKSGYGLTEKVEQLALGGKKVYSVADGALIVSLETGLTLDLVRQVAERKPAQFVAREHGFSSDDVLTNTAQIMKDKGINFRVL